MQKASRNLILKQVKSQIGHPEKHRRILRALGLRGLGKRTTKPDNPSVRGMIRKVSHFVEVTEQRSEGESVS